MRKILLASVLIVSSVLVLQRCSLKSDNCPSCVESDNCPFYDYDQPFVKVEMPDSVKVGETGKIELGTFYYENMEYLNYGYEEDGDTVSLYPVIGTDGCECPVGFNDTIITLSITFDKAIVKYFKYCLVDSVANDSTYYSLVRDSIVGY
jgi:hypothetical protein